MNVALIIAGGSGQRMQQDIPKQFLHIHDKPVIIYTLEGFQRNPQIDAIEVVCLDGWHEVLWANAKQFGIDKLKWVISGGSTAQESIRNGIENLSDVCGAEDILVIHDGIRPMVENFVLDDVIVKCRQYGNGVTSLPYNEQIFVKDDEFTTTKYIPRDTLRRVSTPQAYRYGIIADAYREAFATGVGIQSATYANTLMVELGHRLYFAAGSEKNIKLTTKDDFVLFRAYLDMEKNSILK